ncbi:hypothetical protein HPP92_009170 [Vanilla planifolia]|uniref:Uncharacterized protein n=1 Tax=Vanilla planifolia TaxID=51239 RepID=A0A835R3S3_VANPL|nr:hypothetical protein HPP92_009170 [Vanilla planifolia]
MPLSSRTKMLVWGRRVPAQRFMPRSQRIRAIQESEGPRRVLRFFKLREKKPRSFLCQRQRRDLSGKLNLVIGARLAIKGLASLDSDAGAVISLCSAPVFRYP